MTTPIVVRDAILATVFAANMGFLSVEPHGGHMTLDELLRYGAEAPACRLVCLGWPKSAETGGGANLRPMVTFGAYVVTADADGVARGDAGLNLATNLTRLVMLGGDERKRWGVSDIYGRGPVSAKNMYSGAADKHGVSLWSVTWSEMMLLDPLAAVDGLNDFEEYGAEIYLKPDPIPGELAPAATVEADDLQTEEA